MSAPPTDAPLPALAALHVWRDEAYRPAAENMAIDEALLAWTLATGEAAIRLYVWDHPATTIGYFTRSRDRGIGDRGIGPVRRFTGGGLVEHGDDLTFALTVPAGDGVALAASSHRYRWIHEALADALNAAGLAVATVDPCRSSPPGPCFVNPVPWDLIEAVSGIKIAGGAQRRCRGGFIHQGSVRLAAAQRSPGAPWTDSFLARLSPCVTTLDPETRSRLQSESLGLVASRYGNPVWNARKSPGR